MDHTPKRQSQHSQNLTEAVHQQQHSQRQQQQQDERLLESNMERMLSSLIKAVEGLHIMQAQMLQMLSTINANLH